MHILTNGNHFSFWKSYVITIIIQLINAYICDPLCENPAKVCFLDARLSIRTSVHPFTHLSSSIHPSWFKAIA